MRKRREKRKRRKAHEAVLITRFVEVVDVGLLDPLFFRTYVPVLLV